MFNIITFDGGGIRGALSINLMERIQRNFPDIIKNTNMFGGTSTGSFIALALAYGISPKKIANLYSMENITYIFDKSYPEITRPKYNNENLKKILTSIFPDNLRLKDLGKLVVIPTFHLGSEGKEWNAIFYNNFPNSQTENAKVIDVAMSSSAAPIYFPTYKNHIDGGMVANDPSLACIIHSIDEELDKDLKNINLLSIGTGYTYKNINDDTSTWSALDWIMKKNPSFPIISVTLQANSQMSQLFSKKLLKENYYRLNPKLEKDIGMDECEELEYLLSISKMYNLEDISKWIKEKW
jgi:patatin-like phospholipase/acyl hydrolase